MKLSKKVSIGASGDEVKILQEKLYNLGYYNNIINSIFDSNTLDAYNNYQKDNDLDITDYITLKSWSYLLNNKDYKKKVKHKKQIKTTTNNIITIFDIGSTYYNPIAYDKTKIKFILGCENEDSLLYSKILNKSSIPQIVIGNDIVFRYDLSYSPLKLDIDTIYVEVCGIGELYKTFDDEYISQNLKLYKDDEVFFYKKKWYNIPNEKIILNIKDFLSYIKKNTSFKISTIEFNFLEKISNFES